MKSKSRVSLGFLTYLAIFSILGFLTAILEISLKQNFGTYSITALLVVLGLGLISEGQVRLWIKRARQPGLQTSVSHLIAGIVGLFAIVIGLLKLIIINNPIFDAMVIIISGIAIIVIIVETWVVK